MPRLSTREEQEGKGTSEKEARTMEDKHNEGKGRTLLSLRSA